MKKLTKQFSILLSVVFITVISCSKENFEPDIVGSSSIPSSSNLDYFFKQNVSKAKQYFTIDASSHQYITGNQGTSLFITPNSFKNHLGNTVTGNITIELIEVLTQADMIWLNKTTTSNGELLESGGELSIKAFHAGYQLQLSNSGSINVSMPTYNPGNMQLFTGTEDSNGNLNWDSTNINVVDTINFDTTITNTPRAFTFSLYGNIAINDSLGWINCDRFYSFPNKTTLEVITPNLHNGENTYIYFFFDDIYAVAPAHWNLGSKSFKSYINSLPIGLNITIVAISEINGQFYSSFTPITITANHSESILLSKTTETDLKNDITNL